MSGFSWVPAGAAAVVAVQHIGIACGQAVWQATIISSSFIWGYVVLRDEVIHNWLVTSISLILLLTGLLGMTASFNMSTNETFSQKDASSTLAGTVGEDPAAASFAELPGSPDG